MKRRSSDKAVERRDLFGIESILTIALIFECLGLMYVFVFNVSFSLPGGIRQRGV